MEMEKLKLADRIAPLALHSAILALLNQFNQPVSAHGKYPSNDYQQLVKKTKGPRKRENKLDLLLDLIKYVMTSVQKLLPPVRAPSTHKQTMRTDYSRYLHFLLSVLGSPDSPSILMGWLGSDALGCGMQGHLAPVVSCLGGHDVNSRWQISLGLGGTVLCLHAVVTLSLFNRSTAF